MPPWMQQAVNGLHYWADSIQQFFHSEAVPLPIEIIIGRLLVAFVFGALAAGIHRLTCRRSEDGEQPALAATLVLLAVLIALVMMVIGDNLARAFGLAGALAIVRFRTVVEDTRDTAFVMFAVVSGMAAGTGYVLGPIACTPVILLAAWLFRRRLSFGGVQLVSLVVRMSPGKPIQERVAELLDQHVSRQRLTGLATARGGTALDATYEIVLPPADRVFTLVDELSKIEGVQGVEVK